ncbi:MAG: PAS domain S-box protein, partial [Desulfobaccales bacterium]
MASIGNYWKIPWHLVLIFVFLSTGTLVLGYLYYEKQTVHLQREMEGKIKAIANLKVKEIVAWRQERLHDALTIFDDPIFAREVLEWLEGRAAPHRKAEITHRMQGLKQNLYEKITLLDPQGTVRLAIPKTDPEISPLIKETALDSLRRHRVIFTDLHLDPKKEIKLDLIVPIHFHESGKTINIGTILLKIDPYLSLYPFILSWPTLSDTAEFALVRREENEIVYLNELRHHKDTALLLRLPLTDEDDPGVKATLGKEEVTEGIDYRGVPVLAATRAIPDSPWFLVAKIDISEINAPLKEQFWLMAFLLIALIVSSGIGIAYFWRNREVLFYRQQYEVERERRDLAQKYEYLIKHANDIILTMDQDFKIIEANDLAISSYGYPREELFRLQLEDLYAQEHRRLGETPVAEMEAQNGRTYETVHRRRDGTTFPVAISSSEMEINGDKLYQSIIRDITKSKKREKALLESEEQLRFLSSQLLMVQENERRRISKELHDELGSSLMALKFHLSSIEARLAK